MPSQPCVDRFDSAIYIFVLVPALMMACIIFGLWSSTFWVPTLILTKLTAAGKTPAEAVQRGAAFSPISARSPAAC